MTDTYLLLSIEDFKNPEEVLNAAIKKHKVKKFGNGAYVSIPKKYLDRYVYLILAENQKD